MDEIYLPMLCIIFITTWFMLMKLGTSTFIAHVKLILKISKHSLWIPLLAIVSLYEHVLIKFPLLLFA